MTIAWHQRRRHLPLISAAMLLLCGCNGLSKATKVGETDNGDGNTTPAGANPNPNGGFSQGQPPVPVTGVNLADYHNARIRCDYRTAAPHVYAAQCAVVAHTGDSQEVFATGIATGVKLAWQPPQPVRGAMTFTNCAPNSTQLAYLCTVSVTDPRQLAEANFSVQVQDTANNNRTAQSTLLLPYSVNVAAGFVPNMPFSYQAQTQGGAGSAPAGAVGFQHFGFPATITAFPFPNGICWRGDRLFFADQFSVYQVQNGQITHYAGSGNIQNIFNTSDKTRTFIQPAYIACTPAAIYVSSTSLNRIYKLTDDGAASVVAGNGSSADAADGSLAANSAIQEPRGLAVDRNGNILFADLGPHKVRMVTPQGLLQTFAGSGTVANSGDGGPATAAGLISPISVYVAADDSVYISDVDAATVRRVDKAGIISTVAGTGVQRYATTPPDPRALAEPQQVVMDPTGTLYISELFRGVKKLLPDGTLAPMISAGPDIMASARQLRADVRAAANLGQTSPNLAVVQERAEFAMLARGSDGSLYTEGPQGVLAYPPPQAAAAAGSVTPANIYAGSNEALPSDCQSAVQASLVHMIEAAALAFAPDNKLVVADWQSLHAGQLVLRSIYPDPAGGFLSRVLFGCDSPAVLSAYNPTAVVPVTNSIGGLAVGSDGAIYLAMTSANKILKVTSTGAVTIVAGTGVAASSNDGVAAATATINSPVGIATSTDGSLYFVEYPYIAAADIRTVGARVRKIAPNGLLSTVAGTGVAGDSGEDQPAISAQIRASTIAVIPDGRIFLADTGNLKIKMIDQQGLIHTIAGIDQNGPPPTQFAGTQAPATLFEVTNALQAVLGPPTSIAATNDGTVYYVDFAANEVVQVRQHAVGDANWDLSILFGVKRSSDCGTATAQGSAAAGSIGTAIKSSLAIICEGAPHAITIKDTCPSGDIHMAISQTVGNYANVIEIVKPCGS